jgi:uncharacterized protein YjbI with pentapeptide repeats
MMKKNIILFAIVLVLISLSAVYAETNLEGCNLTGSSLQNCILSGVNFK